MTQVLQTGMALSALILIIIEFVNIGNDDIKELLLFIEIHSMNSDKKTVTMKNAEFTIKKVFRKLKIYEKIDNRIAKKIKGLKSE